MEMAAAQVGQRRLDLLNRLVDSVKKLHVPDPANRIRILREIGRCALYRQAADADEWVQAVVPLVGLSSQEVLQLPRYAKKWQDEVLGPLRAGDWIGAPLPAQAIKTLTDKYYVRWGEVGGRV
jgi:hypothetical protein